MPKHKAPPAPAAPAPPAPAQVVAPKRGPGRPRKPQAPQGTEQVRLAKLVTEAESRRDSAAAVYATVKTVAAEMLSIQTRMEVADAWSAYLRATGNHTHALQWTDAATKLAARISALRELSAVDLLASVVDRTQRENAAAMKVIRIR